MLEILYANRFEVLADRLVERLDAARPSVFDAPEIVVPSAAVRRWLTLEIARRHGICAQLRFGFLAQWLWRQIGHTVPEVPEESPFDAAALAWRIDAAFGDASWLAPHERLRGWLEHADRAMRYELAVQVSRVVERMVTYRPDWLEAWSRGERARLGNDVTADDAADQDWQAALWRRLAAQLGTVGRHPAEAFVRALRSGPLPPTLPAAVHVFALPQIAPLHLGLLRALARRIDVHVYALNPCREYWFEIVGPRRLAGLALRGRAEHHEEGNRLLAAWGGEPKSQLSRLLEAEGDDVVVDERFVEPAAGHLLARVQRAVLDLAPIAPASLPLADGDRSLELHTCHSLGREVEVLHDRLLALFAAPDAPAPGEVLVVTPDLEAAAPLIDAVFGTAPADRFVPYAITGRARIRLNAPAHALLELLALAASRMPASAVLGLLQQPVVARRFGLDAQGLELARVWLHESGARWAIDPAHVAQTGLPASSRHTLADGLERLFLGYALPGDGAGQPFDGRLPAGSAEGSDAPALGALWSYVDALAALRRELWPPQPPASWPGRLSDALARFVDPGDDLEDYGEVLCAIGELADRWQRAQVNEPLPLEVVRLALADLLDEPARGGVPTGVVTFAAMSALRSLPYRVVCAIGLDDGKFPGTARAPEFDLVERHPRPGDRQRRAEERAIFLELLLAARDCLHLSHTGRSVRDNSPLPPSVLVDELLDALVPAIATDPADAQALARARARLVVEHPLQPFAEEAFRIDADPRLRSHHREYARALAKRPEAPPLPEPAEPAIRAIGTGDEAIADDTGDDDADTASAAAPFFASALSPPGDEWRDVPLERLIRFFHHPCRLLLRERLGIELDRGEDELEDDEPLVADRDSRRALAARVLPALLAGCGTEQARSLALAGPEMPAGAFGRRALDRELAALHDFAARLAAPLREAGRDPHPVVVEILVDGRRWRIHGVLPGLRAAGLVRYRWDERRPRDLVEAWLQHLMLCACPAAGVEPATTWWSRDGTWRLRRCAEPLPVLETLLRLHERGLAEPLPFFPNTAWSWIDSGGSRAKAAATWSGGRESRFAESRDAAIRLALRGRPDPLGSGFDDFRDGAQAVFGPLHAHLETVNP